MWAGTIILGSGHSIVRFQNRYLHMFCSFIDWTVKADLRVHYLLWRLLFISPIVFRKFVYNLNYIHPDPLSPQCCKGFLIFSLSSMQIIAVELDFWQSGIVTSRSVQSYAMICSVHFNLKHGSGDRNAWTFHKYIAICRRSTTIRVVRYWFFYQYGSLWIRLLYIRECCMSVVNKIKS